MAVKEIKELEDEVREISVADSAADGEEWGEKDIVIEEETEEEEGEKEKEEFSIGDTMLARGSAVESWGGNSLEEELEGEEFEKGFGGDDFEDEDEEEFGGEGFSYEAVGQSGGGDLYGASASSGSDLYGAGGSGSGMDLYGAPGQKGSDSASMYNSGGNSGGESSMYNVAGPGGKKSAMSSVYQVEGGKQKKFREGGKRKRSELEGHVSRPVRARKGVSMM